MKLNDKNNHVNELLELTTMNISMGKVEEVYEYEFLMPDVFLHKDNMLLCSQIWIRDHFYLVGFEPKASMDTIGHIFLYGCAMPGSNETIWNCDTMQKNRDKFYYKGAPCQDKAQIIFAWGRNMKSLRLPKGVGFLIGPNSTINYLVLQVHYKHRDKGINTDKNGIILNYTKKFVSRKAGMIVLGARGVIQPHTVEHMETTCTVREDTVIHPFAFGVHTHRLGKVVSGYVVRQGESGDTWSSIGKKNPQILQKYYAVNDTTPIRKGDILAVRCTMDNSFGRTAVATGRTDKEEMCNFYLLYWVEEHEEPLRLKFCYSAGPPTYYWRRSIENFKNIPHEDASFLMDDEEY